MFNVYFQGIQLTAHPLTMLEIEKIFGRRDKLKSKGYRLIEVLT